LQRSAETSEEEGNTDMSATISWFKDGNTVQTYSASEFQAFRCEHQHGIITIAVSYCPPGGTTKQLGISPETGSYIVITDTDDTVLFDSRTDERIGKTKAKASKPVKIEKPVQLELASVE
jgi:hypothetical protein